MRKQFLSLILTSLALAAFSQNDSVIFADVFESRTANDINAPIYNGRQHMGYARSIEGIPYYLSDDWQKGTLVFQDISYKDVFLKYDLVAGEVIIRHVNGITGIILFAQRIGSFTLSNRRFVNLPSDERSGFKAGIYEELENGRISLFAKRTKLIDEKLVSNTIERKFVDQNSFFALKDGHYYRLKKQKDIMVLIAEKRKEVNALMKASKIKFRFNPELALTKIIEYYNQLSR